MDPRYSYPQWFQQSSAGSRTRAGDDKYLDQKSESFSSSLGGYSMAASGRHDSNVSNFSTSSTGTNYSLDSPTTPLSLISSSPIKFNAYSSYQTSSSNEYNTPRSYLQAPPIRAQPINTKSTPNTLGWTLTSRLISLYKFVVKQNGKERYFELLPDLKITAECPRRVDLDDDDYPVKGFHRCMYPGGCLGKQTTFSRPADLERHYQNFHGDEDMKKKFYCDFTKCTRHHDAFTRKDHYRDHLRDFHQEDLGTARGMNSRSKKSKEEYEMIQAQWLQTRKIFPHYWRCSKCLDRITVAKSGWKCARCQTTCETDRIESRRIITPKTEAVDAMGMDMNYTTSAASYCAYCNGSSYAAVGGQWVPCQHCQSSHQASYSDNSYDEDKYSTKDKYFSKDNCYGRSNSDQSYSKNPSYSNSSSHSSKYSKGSW